MKPTEMKEAITHVSDPVLVEFNVPERIVFNAFSCSSARRGESDFGPSKTVPDKALTIQMILQKFSSGVPLPSLNDLQFTGDSTAPDIRILDLVERDNLRRYLIDHIAKTEAEYKQKLQLRRDAGIAERERMNAALAYIETIQKGGTPDPSKA